MNKTDFLDQLQNLEMACWQALLTGQALLLINDDRLELGATNAHNVIIPAATAHAQEPTQLREQSLVQASQILEDYYRTHPLTETCFNTQVDGLLELLGAAAFTALPGRLPAYTLFVEMGTVLAEPRESPRHPYGAYCEILHPLTDAALQQQVAQWLTSGQAYERYLSMNVCRYNC